MKSSELRESFLRYFEKNGHQRVPSSSLVPASDPTLFFTNAGMVQFKDLFLGNEKRDYRRATTSQKCMRVSGKHNDLENVGHTPLHHTFFEMLGNFSFGDYFKKEAIAYGWEYLTKVVNLPKDRLYVTIYEDDSEAKKLWKKHVDQSRVFKLGEKDNFWAMGDTGPCGPCSEIHYDRAPTGSVKAEDFDTDRFVEIWNLVFMQFNRTADGRMEKLSKPSIDTGMGLERLAMVLQGVSGNYETDLFMPIISQIAEISGRKYGANYEHRASNTEYRDDVSMRVIADHIRAMTFLIGDGVQPSNEGRGYVLRRIIRRAARFGKMLGVKNPFFVPLAHIVIDTMGSSYPEIVQHKEFIEKVIHNEEERFSETLDKGLEILEESFKKLSSAGLNVLPGADVFTLYDTYGFPKDLTQDIASDAGFKIDGEGFEKFMNQQRERARSAWKGSGEEAVDGVYKDLAKKGIKSNFVGYTDLSSDSEISSIIKNGKEVDVAAEGDEIGFVAVTTPFYGDSGGQTGDTGMAVGDGVEIAISDTTKPLEDLTVHHGIVKKGRLKAGERVTLAVDSERRVDITRNHTATHILHSALREVLGEHVKQSGSLVTAGGLRFDFSHFEAVTKEEIAEVEARANRIVRQDHEVSKEVLPYKKALERGTLAFFGDKYGEEVRMISVGDYSRELCGGAHVARTGVIGMIKIVRESGVAAGVRRIEAVTGRGVEEYIRKMENEKAEIALLLKTSGDECPARVEKLLTETKRLQRELEKARAQLFSGKSAEGNDEAEQVGDIKLVAKFIEGADPKELRSLSDNLKTKIKSGVVMLVTEDDSKTSLLIAVTKDLENKLKAGDLIKNVVASIGGTGGGRPDMAQGGAPVTGKFEDLKNSIIDAIK